MRQNQKKNERRLTPVELWLLLAGSIFAGLLLAELLLEVFFTLRGSARVFLVAVIAICYYLFAYLYAKRTNDEIPLRIVQIFLFIIYLACLFDLTLLGKSVGRQHYDKERLDYIDWFVNLHPFRTIKNYIVGFRKGYFNLWWFSANLLGNLLLLAPLSLLLPMLFRLQRRWYVFLPTILLISAVVEALQYLFMLGSCDIDDLILNFIGAVLLFFLFKIPPIRRLLRKITRSEF
ncbi:MAG: VanZ family protein [Clostridia bacterium]|nr:VanZ family protein [Clostridia bacterium]